MGLAYYVLRRLLVFAFLLMLVSFLVFSLLYIAPGDPIGIFLGTQPRTPELVASLRHQYHLDQPFLTQYWIWAKGALQFHFGNSISTTLPVTDSIKARLPLSFFLGVYAFLLTMIIGLALGIGASLKRRTAADRGIVALSVVWLSTPVFVSGVIFLYVFAVLLPWFPVFGQGQGFSDELYHLTLPALALAISAAAFVVKHTRAAMLNVLDQDYVTFARARGLTSPRILLLYSLRNALIPVLTIAGTIFAFLIVGAVLVETTFTLPGIGDLLVQSATNKDIPMLQGVVIVVAAIVMTVNLITDLLYAVVDPRIRLGKGGATT